MPKSGDSTGSQLDERIQKVPLEERFSQINRQLDFIEGDLTKGHKQRVEELKKKVDGLLHSSGDSSSSKGRRISLLTAIKGTDTDASAAAAESTVRADRSKIEELKKELQNYLKREGFDRAKARWDKYMGLLNESLEEYRTASEDVKEKVKAHPTGHEQAEKISTGDRDRKVQTACEQIENDIRELETRLDVALRIESTDDGSETRSKSADDTSVSGSAEASSKSEEDKGEETETGGNAKGSEPKKGSRMRAKQ